MTFRKTKGNPVDYLVAAAVHVCDTNPVEYSTDFRDLVTIALSPFDPSTSAEEMAKADPDRFQQAASLAIAEAATLALARGDSETVPAIASIGVSLAMRFTMYLNLRQDEEEGLFEP
jgi:hypothetical protein